ncbi:MAG TPA: hypothetical protein VK524_31605, partial [Polyangiaceae bacterium]|nr:hypothetical protein [Polyangiaceae bacterium]
RTVHALQRTEPHAPDRFVLVDTRVAPKSELLAAAQQFSIVAAGPLWRVDRASSPTPIEALRFEQRQPRGLEWFLDTGTDLVRSVGGPDPWATWEWRQLLDQDTGTPAPAEPRGLEQVRLAHNMAVSRGDAARAQRLRERLLRALDRRLDARVGDNLTLLGWILESGAIHVAHLYWQTAPQFAAWDGDFRVRSRVVAKPALWWSAIDFYEKEVATPGSAAIPLWKPGNLYVQRFVVMKRIGRESFEGFLAARDGGTARSYRVPLFTLD